MTSGFWGALPRPFFALAPIANVTDAAFRRLIAAYGKPDAFFTEFVSCDGLCSRGREVLLRDLMFSEGEHPIVAQLFGARPDNFTKCAELVRQMGFDGIDINMGCPDRNVERQGAGAALMKNPKLARDIIRAAKAGAGPLPVSIKTRIGYTKNTIDTWLPELLAEEPAAITIHARTRQEMSDAPARWEVVKQAVDLAKGSGCYIIGNGDVLDLADARRKVEATGADGVMLGRAIFGNPWLFNEAQPVESISIPERLQAMVQHTRLFNELLGDVKGFSIMKKHYKAYIHGFQGSKELRLHLMETKNVEEVVRIVQDFIGLDHHVTLRWSKVSYSRV